MKKNTSKTLTTILAYLFLGLFLIAIGFGGIAKPVEPSESISEPVIDTQEEIMEEPVREPENEQEEVVSEEVEETSEDEPDLLDYRYFDVPLDLELQEYIFMVCDLYGMEPAIIVAMIEKESTYHANIIGDSGRSFGLMQIQERWHRQRMLDLGVTDLLDPYQNVSVGIDYISELYANDLGIYWALMAYNGGVKYANGLRSQGVVSDYAKTVYARSHELGWRVWLE